ncbi:MAG: YggT family protein [bacterium]|jgi:YggT family protein
MDLTLFEYAIFARSDIRILLSNLISIYEFILFIRIIFSWINPDPRNPIVAFIAQITDPLLDAVRNAFPFLTAGGIDFSPIVLFFLLELTRGVIL